MWLVDSAQLNPGQWTVTKWPGVGIPGDQVPATGSHGPSPLLNDLDLPADAKIEVRMRLESKDAGLTVVLRDDGSVVQSAESPGAFNWYYRAFANGVDKGVAPVTVVLGGNTLAVQEAGSDSFAASGQIGVSGAVAAQETGSDSFAASGQVSVTGSLAAQETSADAFAAAGEISSQGALAAQEAGADSFSASGWGAAQGELVAAEQGADSFVASGHLVGDTIAPAPDARSVVVQTVGRVATIQQAGRQAQAERLTRMASIMPSN